MIKELLTWLRKIIGNVTPTKWPTVATAVKIYTDGTGTTKVCSVWKAACGVIVACYNGLTRMNSWLVRIDQNGNSSRFNNASRETQGTPALHDGWWFVPSEAHDSRVIKMRDRDAAIDYGPSQPDVYSTRALARSGEVLIAYNYKGRPIQLWDMVSRKKIKTWDMDKFEGIVSGICEHGSDLILSVMDGNRPGVASVTKGWILRGSYPEVASVGGRLIAFHKDGSVQEINASSGEVERIIASTGNKAQRARVRGGLCYFSTANWDQLWVSDGKSAKLLYEWKDGDRPDSTTSGSLFNTSIDFDGDDIIFARSIDGRGVEVWRVMLK